MTDLIIDNDNNNNNNNSDIIQDEFKSYEFKCDLSHNIIELRCNIKKEAYMEYTNIDINLPKSFFVLLRTSIDFLKNNNFKNIIQTVSEKDWNNFLSLNKKWKIKSQQSYGCEIYLNIECSIDDALDCISKGLGFNLS